jgi:proteasome lid subunit RPN8/RPN11
LDIVTSIDLDTELAVWQAAGCSIRIDYSRAVMQDLKIAAVDGFTRMAHGGVEIGGVLFGVRDSDGVKVLAHRALECEYAFGPSFTLSDNDRRAFEDLLSLLNTDRELSGMEPVGWYHSHTRSDILLSEKDLALYQQFFPDSWQIALVLRPHRFDNVRAGFFFREPDGSVHATSTRHEFVIASLPSKPAAPAPPKQKAAAAASAPAQLAIAAPAELVIAAPAELAIADPAPLEPVPQPLTIPRISPSLPDSPPRRVAFVYLRRSWVWNAAAFAVLSAGLLYWIGSTRASADFSLHAIEVGGQLRIDWSREPKVARQSETGALEIEDGTVKLVNALSSEQLRAGSLTYVRTTGDVVVRLKVRDGKQTAVTRMARFVGMPVAIAAPPPIGSAARSAETPEADRVPLRRKPEPEPRLTKAKPKATPVTAKEDRRKLESPRPLPAVVAPARRFMAPNHKVSAPREIAVPPPPLIAANGVPAMAALMPRLPAPHRAAEQGPRAGKIIWAGRLTRRGTIQILGNHASQGHLTGALPGAPVRVVVFPAELTQDGLRIYTADPKLVGPSEAPGSQNGWNRTQYVLNARQAGDIRVVEAPGTQNSWNKLVLRAERGDYSIVVLRWERLLTE